MEHIQMVFEDGSHIPYELVSMFHDGRVFKTASGDCMMTSIEVSHGSPFSWSTTKAYVEIERLRPKPRVKVIRDELSDRENYIIEHTAKLTKAGFSKKEVTAMVKMLVKAKFK